MKPDDIPSQGRRILVRWLAEWNIDRALPPAAAAAGQGTATARRFVASFGSPVQPLRCGDIRLLHPVWGGLSFARPVYILLVEDVANGSYVVAPFGRFSTPGLPGEWRTGLRALPLRVLCLWNWREVPERTLRRSWRAGRMTPAKLKQATLALGVIRGRLPPDRLPPGQFGPPVRHPLDPRLIYEAEEAAAFDEEIRLLGKGTVAVDAWNVRLPNAGESGGCGRLLAAEPEAAHDFGKKPKRNKT